MKKTFIYVKVIIRIILTTINVIQMKMQEKKVYLLIVGKATEEEERVYVDFIYRLEKNGNQVMDGVILAV